MSTFEEDLAKGIRTLSRRDPVIRGLVKAHRAPDFRPHDDYYPQLVRSIIYQQITGKAAESILRKFSEAVRGEFTPEVIAAVPDELLRGAGISPQKLSYLRSLTGHVLDRRLDLATIAMQPDDRVITDLTAVKGIGTWTAHMFLIFSLGRLDVLPTGDLGVRNGVQLAYGLPEPPTPRAVEELAAGNNWAPYRTIGAWYMWRAVTKD